MAENIKLLSKQVAKALTKNTKKRINDLKNKKEFKEVNRYQDSDFPVNVYYADIHSMQPPGRWLHDFHWHEELQFTLVTNGSLTMQADNSTIKAKKGDIIFINSTIIHAVTQMSADGSYASLNFPFRLLAFFPGSRMDKDYVLPYITGEKFSSLLISPHEPWHKDMAAYLKKIIDLFISKQVQGNEYSICVMIVSIWKELISNYRTQEAKKTVNVLRQQRLQNILTYIYDHYSEDLQLGDLAKAGSISNAECCRIFHDILHTSPYNYLKNYRIQASVALLKSDLSVSEIAGRVGYNQVSNYIATFKRIIGCTPAQYRKQQK